MYFGGALSLGEASLGYEIWMRLGSSSTFHFDGLVASIDPCMRVVHMDMCLVGFFEATYKTFKVEFIS